MLLGCTKEETTETQKKVTATESKQDITPAEAKAIAREAYVYGLPMVVNYKTMYMYMVNKQSPEYKGPFDYLACEARLYTPNENKKKHERL